MGGGKVGMAAPEPVDFAAFLQDSRKEDVAAAMPRKSPVLRNVLFSIIVVVDAFARSELV